MSPRISPGAGRSASTSKDDDALKKDLKKALDKLEEALLVPSAVPTTAIQDLIDHLVSAARLVAVYWFELAETACGACPSSASVHVCHAETKLHNGDDQLLPPPDFSKAVDEFGKTADEAVRALGECP